MNLSRRKFFALAAVAPAIIRTPGLLMPIKPTLSGRPRLDIDRIMEIQYRMANPPLTAEESDVLVYGSPDAAMLHQLTRACMYGEASVLPTAFRGLIT